MHFSKTYSQLLLTLPDELRNSAIEYRQLKKLINQLVEELESLGLSPLILHELLKPDDPAGTTVEPATSSRRRSKGKERALGERPSDLDADSHSLLSVSLPPSVSSGRSASPARVVYELADGGKSGDIVPRLRLWVDNSEELVASSLPRGRIEDLDDSDDANSSSSPSRTMSQTALYIDTPSETDSPPAEAILGRQHGYTPEDIVIMSSPIASHPRHNLLWSLQERNVDKIQNSWSAITDTEYASHLGENGSTTTVNGNGNRQVVIPLASDTAFFRLLTTALNSLSAALNASREDFTLSIQALSTVIARTSRPASAKGKSDLYTWRAIFQLYLEAQVFESTSERDRGERSIEESEARLAQFAHRVGKGGFSLTMAASRDGLERFLELNVRLMNLKKVRFQTANAEAARKILKKHAKRTALPLPSSAMELIPALEIGQATASVPHVLVVALTETLMPVVPHIDDYLCLICTAIAFKPIRLRCGHLFCVRCLVKMQKQGKANCPMCRAPTVITADKSNVDYALINFMRDWFPKETKEKGKANERESAQEEMDELGLDTRCTIT